MADDRFADVIKWDTSGRAMVIEDFQLFWARGTSIAYTCDNSDLLVSHAIYAAKSTS